MTRRLAALALPLAAGLSYGVIEPRGPVTGIGAAVWVVGSAVLGWFSGRFGGSRWFALLAPALAVLGFECARASSPLPTVGGPHFDTAFGILAFVLGHVLWWVLAAVPMALGAAAGAHRVATPGRRVWRGVQVAALAVLAAGLAWPASAPPVRGEGGAEVPGGFAELRPVILGGVEQWIEVRGTRADNPVLLYLSGGPGQSDLALSRAQMDSLLDDVTFVGWDQRGTGHSYAALNPATLTLDAAVNDTVELARYLTTRFHQPKVALLGESWGSLLGILAVQQAPELFSAYIGSGQMVDLVETDTAIYTDLLAVAERDHDAALRAQLERMGRPPYHSVLDYGFVFSQYERLEGDYTPPAAYLRRGADSGVGPMGVLGSEYDPVTKVNVLRGLLDMFAVMYPQLQGIDLRRDVPRVSVPVVIMAGEHELAGRTRPARQWFEALAAPSKRWHSYPDAGHAVAFEKADELRRILRDEVGVSGD